jgi:hypothetical protein
LEVDRSAGTCLLRLTGNVEVTTQDAVLQADEADYRCRAGEIGYDIEPRGNVHLTVFPKQQRSASLDEFASENIFRPASMSSSQIGQFFEPVTTGLEIAAQLLKLYPKDFAAEKFNQLLANQKVYDAFRQGASGRALRQIWESDLANFRVVRSRYLLY